MLSTALPLRVMPDGKLEQQDGVAALLALLAAMANTTADTWPHARWFGLLEAFTEAAERQRQDHEGLRDAINAALGNLGVTAYSVQSVVTGGQQADGRRKFQITFVEPSGRPLFGEVAAA